MPQSKWPVRKPVGHFFDYWLMLEGLTHCGQCFSWASGPACYKKANKWIALLHGLWINFYLQVPFYLSFFNGLPHFCTVIWKYKLKWTLSSQVDLLLVLAFYHSSWDYICFCLLYSYMPISIWTLKVIHLPEQSVMVRPCTIAWMRPRGHADS